jgi:benzoate membrane transport protein
VLAGLALLGTIGGSLFQAVHQASERDAAVLTFLTAGPTSAQ